MSALLLLLLLPFQLQEAAPPQRTYDEAMSAGIAELEAKNYELAHESFSEAVTKATKPSQATRAYEQLKALYEETIDFDRRAKVYETLLMRRLTAVDRQEEVVDFAKFLHRNRSIERIVAKYEKRLESDPGDLSALGIITSTAEVRRKSLEERESLRKRFVALHRAYSAKLAEDAELKARQAMGEFIADQYAIAAMCWGEARNTDRVRRAVQKCKASQQSADPAIRRTVHTMMGDGLCYVGLYEEGLTELEAALELKDHGDTSSLISRIEQARRLKSRTQQSSPKLRP